MTSRRTWRERQVSAEKKICQSKIVSYIQKHNKTVVSAKTLKQINVYNIPLQLEHVGVL